MTHTLSSSTEDNVEIHAIDTDGRIVFQTQVNVLCQTKSKMSHSTERGLGQLVFLHLQTTFQDFYTNIQQES